MRPGTREFVLGKNRQLLTGIKHVQVGDKISILHPCNYSAQVLEVLGTGFVLSRDGRFGEPFQVKNSFLRGKIEYILREVSREESDEA